MMKDRDFDVVHNGSLLDQPVMKVDTYASALEDDFEDKHYVPTGVDYTDEQLASLSKNSGNDFERFELTRAGRKVKKLTISSELSGVQVEFEDDAQKVAGASSVEARPGKKQLRSITFHDDELVTESDIAVLVISNERICAGAGINPVKQIAYIMLKTNFGQKYGEVSLAAIGLRKWGKNYLDNEKGSLIGVYGIAGPDGLLSLGPILAPAQDVVEYRFLNMQYDLEAFQCVGDRMLSLKEQTVINDSNATVDSQVKFAHTYTVTSNFSNTHGLKAGVKTEINAGLPFVVEGKVEVSGEYSCKFVWGRGVSTSKTDEWTATISAPPHSRLRGRATVTESTIDVPYSADLLITKADGSNETVKETSGVYRGVNVSDFRVEIEEVPG